MRYEQSGLNIAKAAAKEAERRQRQNIAGSGAKSRAKQQAAASL